jgi:peptidoglycan hydrolase-like protein with peptidoglycan-binding domain
MPFVLLVLLLAPSPAFLAAQAPEQLSREEVRKAQQALKVEGFDPGPLDGIFGPLTRSAVRKFQRSNNMRVTGALDRSTKDRLAEKLAKRAPSAPENLKVIEIGVE